jgi:hypothetical protein
MAFATGWLTNAEHSILAAGNRNFDPDFGVHVLR